MIEFMTPHDIMEKFVDMVEKQRIRKHMTQEELYKASGMTARSYGNFIITKSTKFTNIINLLIALDMTSKIEELIKIEEFTSLDDIRNAHKAKTKKRVKKGKLNERT